MAILFFVLILLCFLFWLFRPKEPSGIVLYFANIGSGKTTYLSKLAIRELKRIDKGKSRYDHIISNAQISGVIYEPNIRKLLKNGAIQRTLILIDEGSIVYNNRLGMSKNGLSELEIQYFKLIRHYTSTCIVVSQSYDDIDVTLRRLYSEIYLLRYLPLFTLIQPIRKSVGIDEISKQIIDEYKFRNIFSWRLFFRPRYYKYFNSWWIPDDIQIFDLEMEQFKNKIQPQFKQPRKFLGFVKDKDLKLEMTINSEAGPT